MHDPAARVWLSPGKNVAALARDCRALMLILGKEGEDDADYLELCRRKRNITEYDRTGVVTEADAEELIEFTKDSQADVLDWLKKEHPNLVPV